MNFFKLYMGDYQRDTGALSIAEHGAYFLMLQYHYATEKPLPTGKDLYRLLRCESKADRAAVDAVAMAYWKETPDGLINERAEREIAIAQEMEGGTEERKKNERERQRRHRERRKEMYDTLRARGITPPFDATTDELQALCDGDSNVTVTRDITVAVTPDATANHSQTPEPIKSKPSSASADLPAEFVQFWAVYPRKVGKPSALKAWKRLRPDDVLTNLILKAIAASKWSEEMRFIPHPATWLGDRRFEDQSEPSKVTSMVKRAAC